MTKTGHREGERSLRGHFKAAFVTGGRIIYQAKRDSLNRLKLNHFNKTEGKPGAHSGLLIKKDRWS